MWRIPLLWELIPVWETPLYITAIHDQPLMDVCTLWMLCSLKLAYCHVYECCVGRRLHVQLHFWSHFRSWQIWLWAHEVNHTSTSFGYWIRNWSHILTRLVLDWLILIDILQEICFLAIGRQLASYHTYTVTVIELNVRSRLHAAMHVKHMTVSWKLCKMEHTTEPVYHFVNFFSTVMLPYCCGQFAICRFNTRNRLGTNSALHATSKHWRKAENLFKVPLCLRFSGNFLEILYNAFVVSVWRFCLFSARFDIKLGASNVLGNINSQSLFALNSKATSNVLHCFKKVDMTAGILIDVDE